ncbi:ATP-dependent protease [Planctomycetales bacterium 10988]|nr:ATP-dependent protease [Planctomycetales bacterium 10988]
MCQEDFNYEPSMEEVARLFPLPNHVVFPHVLQPLHVFEPRYREMIQDAMQGDRMIAMSLLEPGWEEDYEGRPPIFPTVCMCRIATCHQFDDGRYNLLAQGVCRARIVEELSPSKQYREAKIEILHDHTSLDKIICHPQKREKLVTYFRNLIPQIPEAQKQFKELLKSDLGLGTLADIIAYTVDLDLTIKTDLLAEVDVDKRTDCLIQHLYQMQQPTKHGDNGEFPPEFSSN